MGCRYGNPLKQLMLWNKEQGSNCCKSNVKLIAALLFILYSCLIWGYCCEEIVVDIDTIICHNYLYRHGEKKRLSHWCSCLALLIGEQELYMQEYFGVLIPFYILFFQDCWLFSWCEATHMVGHTQYGLHTVTARDVYHIYDVCFWCCFVYRMAINSLLLSPQTDSKVSSGWNLSMNK